MRLHCTQVARFFPFERKHTMTPAHVFFIPTMFLLGFITGSLVSRGAPRGSGSATGYRAASWANGKSVGIALVVLLATFVATHMFPLLGGVKALHHVLNGQRIFDQHASFTSAEVYERLDGFGPLGRAMYQQFTYTADLIFPLSMLAFLVLLARFVVDRSGLNGSMRKLLQGLPLVWFSADMLENTMVYTLIAQFPQENNLLASTLGFVTTAKFALLLLSLLAPAVGSVLFRRNDALPTLQR